MKRLIQILFLALLPFLSFGQDETKMHTKQLHQSGASSGQFLKFNGSDWIPDNPPSGADNWGSQVVESDATMAGDGTSASPLGIAQQAATTGQALKWNGSTWLPDDDEVDDADADASNELQTMNLDTVNEELELSGGVAATDISDLATDAEVSNAVSNVVIYDKYVTEEFESLTTGNTVTLVTTVPSTNYEGWLITRGGLQQKIGTSSADCSVSGQVVTFNLRDFEDGEKVFVKIPKQ